MNHGDMTYCSPGQCPVREWCLRAKPPKDNPRLSMSNFFEAFQRVGYCSVFAPHSTYPAKVLEGNAIAVPLVCPGCEGGREIEVIVPDPKVPCLGGNDPDCVDYHVPVECIICDGQGVVSPDMPEYEEALRLLAMRLEGKGLEVDDLVHDRAKAVLESQVDEGNWL